jgi:hypothetical protein
MYVLPIWREKFPSFPQDCELRQSFTAMLHALFLSSVTMRRSTYTYTRAPTPILQKTILSFWVFRPLIQSFTIFHNFHYFEIPHVVPCIRQNPQIFYTERKQLDYTKADKPSSISYPNSAADPSTFPSSTFILSFCFLNSVRKAKTFPGNLRNSNQQDALFYSQFISILNLHIFRYFEQFCCSSSGDITLYIQKLICVMSLCWLGAKVYYDARSTKH